VARLHADIIGVPDGAAHHAAGQRTA